MGSAARARASPPTSIAARRRTKLRWRRQAGRSQAKPGQEDCNRKTAHEQPLVSAEGELRATSDEVREPPSGAAQQDRWVPFRTAATSGIAARAAVPSYTAGGWSCGPAAPTTPRHPPLDRSFLREKRSAPPRRGRRKRGNSFRYRSGAAVRTWPADADEPSRTALGRSRDSRTRRSTPRRTETSGSRRAHLRFRTIHAGPWIGRRRVRKRRQSPF